MGEQEMPDVLEKLTRRIGDMAERNPEPLEFSLELHSDRELTGTDPEGLVTVTMKDFKVDTIEVNDYWLTHDRPSPAKVQKATIAAINKVLQDYLLAEMEEMKKNKVSLGEMHSVLQEFTTEFAVASQRAWDRLDSYT